MEKIMKLHNPWAIDNRRFSNCKMQYSRRRVFLPGLALLAFSSAGCVTMDPISSLTKVAVSKPACQVVVTWFPEVVFTPDPAHKGEPAPGLAGRVYLFGPEIGAPLVGDGSIVVDLYEDAPAAKARPPVPLEEWRLDRDTLARLKRKDAVGWGYTIFLPWGTYKPEITHVHLRLRYDPVGGSPLYAEGSPMILKTAQNPIQSSGSTVVAPPTRAVP
jgi:hypothetical protein